MASTGRKGGVVVGIFKQPNPNDPICARCKDLPDKRANYVKVAPFIFLRDADEMILFGSDEFKRIFPMVPETPLKGVHGAPLCHRCKHWYEKEKRAAQQEREDFLVQKAAKAAVEKTLEEQDAVFDVQVPTVKNILG